MRLEPTPIEGVLVVRAEPVVDERGHFVRVACRETFEGHGLPGVFDLTALSWNRRRGTLRGMHWQRPPHAEHKLVRATRGAIFDVALDMRPQSPTLGRWYGVRLDATASAPVALFIGPGVAHGFQTLEDDSEVEYQIAGRTVPEAACGARWDDPAFGIRWPLPVTVMSARDVAWPLTSAKSDHDRRA